MKTTHQYYTAQMEYSDDTIRLMFKTEYYTYEKLRLALRYALSILLVAAGLLLQLPIAAQAICLMIGAWLFISPDFPSKVRAEGVIQQRGGQTSTVHMTFDGKVIGVGNGLTIAYSEIDRLIEDNQYYYIFRDRQTAVMVPKGGIQGGTDEAFRNYMEEKTGKTFEKNKNFLNMNLKDIVAILRDEIAQKKARKRR